MKESMESQKIFLFVEMNISKLIKYLTNMCQNYENIMIIKIEPKLDLILKTKIETLFYFFIESNLESNSWFCLGVDTKLKFLKNKLIRKND